MAKNQKLATIEGETPDPRNYKIGCEFANRCAHVMPECTAKDIPTYEVNGTHIAKCPC